MQNGPRYGQRDAVYATRLATTPPEEDGPVWMVNLMKYREKACLLYTSPSPRDATLSRMPSSA